MEKEEFDYAKVLRSVRDMPIKRMKKINVLFKAFNSPSNQAILKYLAAERVKGNKGVWRTQLFIDLKEKYKFSRNRLEMNLRRLFAAGIVVKRKTGRRTMYMLSPGFRNICQAIYYISPILENVVLSEEEDKFKTKRIWEY